MGDDDEWPKLPTEDKVVHKSWKARVAGYEEAAKSFALQTDPKSNEYSKYLGTIKKFVIDTNAVAQEKGLVAVLSFVENSAFAGKVCSEIIAGIVAKVLNARPKTKQLGIDICLLFIELEKQEFVMEELMKGFENKQPKIIAGCTALVKQALSDFGSKVVAIKPLVKAIPKLLDHSDKTVRAEAKNLAIEIYRWIRDAIRTPLQGIKPVVMKELDEEWGKLDATPPQPTRYTKSEQAKRAVAPPPVEATATDEGDGAPVAQPVASVDPYDLLDAVDILSQLPKGFYEQVAHTKWQERKEALEGLEKLTSSPKLEGGQYGDIMAVLKKVISKDSNVMIVAVAARCVVGLAKGLRKKFTAYAPMITRSILEKFKEKKLNVVIPLRDAIDAVHKTTNLENMLEDILEVLESKNPSIKEELCKFLTRVFAQSTQAKLPKSVLKPVCALLIKKMDDTAGPVRDAAAEALGTAMKAVGQKALSPYVDQLDKIKTEKVIDCFNKAELVTPAGGAVVAAAPPKPAAAAAAPAASKPAASKPPSKPSSKTATKKPKEAKATKSAGGKKPVKGGGGAKKAAKKANPYELDLEEPTEPELPDGVIEEKSVEIFGEESVKQLASSNWKERLAAIEEMTKKVNGLTEGNLPSQVLVRTLTKKPGLKDNNFQVLKLKFTLLGRIAQMSKPFSRRSALYAIEGLIEKIADMKVMEVVKDTLKIFAENLSLNYVSLKAAKIASEAKNPKIATESLNWMCDALKEFGFKIDLKPHLTFIKTSLQHVNPGIRGSAVQFLSTLYIYVGPNLRVFFEDEKPALLKQIDAEFEKVKDEKPPAPTRRLIDDEPEDEGQDNEDGGAEGDGSDAEEGQVNLADLVERFDISDKITDALIAKLGDKNWKIRNEGLEEVKQIIADAKFIKANLGELPAAIKGRLGDSNKNLVKTTLGICKTIAEAGGPKMAQHCAIFLPGIIGTYVDSKPQVRAATTEALDAWHAQVGFIPFVEGEILLSCMMIENPNLRSGLLGWLEAKLPKDKKLPNEFNEIIFPLLKCLEDRNPEVRKNAQAVLPLAMAHAGFDVMSKCTTKLEASSRTSALSLLEKARETCVPIKSAKKASSKPVQQANAPAAKSAPAKEVKESTAKTEKATKPTKKTAAPATRKGKKVEEDEGPPFILKIGKEQRFKEEKTLKVLKWNFATPRDDCVQQLKDQMAPCVSTALHNQLFHSDFKLHINALNTMTAAVQPDADGVVVYKDALLETSDLFLKWVTLRFFDTNTSVLLKSLEFLDGLLLLMSSESVKLHEYEATSFLPYLINKIGDPKDNVRKSIHSLLKLITKVYPSSKLFVFLMDGLTSKNSKTRMECLEELAFLISKFSLTVCQPSPPKALKEIAAQIGDRDKGVRSSALNALVNAYNLCGDQVYKYIGRLPDKDQSYLDERIKRAGKAQSIKPVTAAPSGIAKAVDPGKAKADAEVEALKATARSLLASKSAPPVKKEFEIDYDAIEGGETVLRGSELKLIEVDIEPASAEGDQISHNLASMKARKQSYGQSPDKVRNVTALLDWTIAQISSSDINTSMEALCQLEEVFKKKTEMVEVAKKVDQYLLQCLVQSRMLFSKHINDGSNDKETLINLMKLLLSGPMTLFSHPLFARSSSRDVLKDTIANYINMLHSNSAMQFEDSDQIIRSINLITLRIIEHSDHNACLGALLLLLQECVENEKTPAKYTELVHKCIWKMIRQLPKSTTTKVDMVLEDCDKFLRRFPSSYWKKATDKTPLSTIKSLLLTLCKTCGDDILNQFGLIKDPETSQVISYLKLNYKSVGHTTSSKEKTTDNSGMRGSESDKRPLDQVDNKDVTKGTRSTSDMLIDIFQKIGTKENTAQGLSDLYDFKQTHPDEDLSPFIKNTTQFFQNYIEQGLEKIEMKRKSEQQIANQKHAESTVDDDTSKYRDRLKYLTSNFKEREAMRSQDIENQSPQRTETKPEEVVTVPQETASLGDVDTATDEKPQKKVDVDDIRKRLEMIRKGNIK